MGSVRLKVASVFAAAALVAAISPGHASGQPLRAGANRQAPPTPIAVVADTHVTGVSRGARSDIFPTAPGCPPCTAPKAVIKGPSDVTVGETVTYDGSGSTPAGGLSFAWSVGGVTGSGPTISVTWTSPGQGSATLTVTDMAGMSDTASVGVNVRDNAPAPPTCVAAASAGCSPHVDSLTIGPSPGEVGKPVTYTAKATDPDNDISTYHWNFDGGITADTGSPSYTHTYTVPYSPGQDAVSVSVVDKQGNKSNTVAESVEIRPAPAPTPAPVAPAPSPSPSPSPSPTPDPFPAVGTPEYDRLPDRDHDGIPDIYDFCPDDPGPPPGCPSKPPAPPPPEEESSWWPSGRTVAVTMAFVGQTLTIASYLPVPWLQSVRVIRLTAQGLKLVGDGLKWVAGGVAAYTYFTDPSRNQPKPKPRAALVGPTDSDYQVVAGPTRQPGPHAGALPGRLRGVARAIDALNDNSYAFGQHVLAVVAAVNRAAAASQAADDKARRTQLQAALLYGRAAADLLGRQPALLRRLAAALARAGLRVGIGPRDLRAAQRKIARNGLSRESAANLRRFGASETWIRQYDADLRRHGLTAPVDFRRLVRRRVELSRVLRDRTFTAQLREAASALRRQVEAYVAGAG